MYEKVEVTKGPRCDKCFYWAKCPTDRLIGFCLEIKDYTTNTHKCKES